MGEQLVGGAVRTHTALIEFTIVYGHGLWHPKTVTVVNTRDCCLQIITANIIIMKKFEISEDYQSVIKT